MSNYYHLPVVGIDIAANFSIVTALKPDGDIYQKNLRIEHTLCGFNKLLTFLQKIEEELGDIQQYMDDNLKRIMKQYDIGIETYVPAAPLRQIAKKLGLGDKFCDGDIEAGFNYQIEPSGLTVEELRKKSWWNYH